MMALPIAQHYTDVSLGGDQYKRSIQNWANYRDEASGLYLPAVPDYAQDVSPYVLGGNNFTFRTKGAMWIYGGEQDDAGNTTTVGMHVSDAPSKFLLMKARNVNAVPWTKLAGNRALRWSGLWANSDLFMASTSHKLEKTIRLNNAGHPASFSFDIQIPESVAVTETAAGWLLTKDNHQYLLRKGNGWDSTQGGVTGFTDEPNMPVTTDLTRNEAPGDGFRYLRIRLTPNTAGLTYPCFIDPTATVSGTTDLEDTYLKRDSSDFCYGGAAQIKGGWGDPVTREHTWLVRVATSAMPVGTIDAFRYLVYQVGHVDTDTTHDLKSYIVKAGNDWAEGSANVVQNVAGEPSWDFKAEDDVSTWLDAGGGCRSISVDLEADASPPTFAIPAPFNPPQTETQRTMTLKAAWITNWRDSIQSNQGFANITTSRVAGSTFFCNSTEAASNQPIAEIDYTEPSGDGRRGVMRGAGRGILRGL